MTTRRVVNIRTPTGQIAVIRPVAEQLLANGVISGSLDGDVHASDAATIKAAMMSINVCDFCTAPGATDVFEVPDFQLTPVHRSTGGWAACAECASMIRADQRKDLLRRSLDRMAFSKFTAPAIQELHERFWRAMEAKAYAAGAAAAFADFVEDRLPDGPAQHLTSRDLRLAAVARETGLTREQVESFSTGEISAEAVEKLVAFNQKWDAHKNVSDRRAFVDRILAPHKPLQSIVPHWQRALDARFAALTRLSDTLHAMHSGEFFPDAVDLNDRAAVQRMASMAQARKTFREMGFQDDAKYLRVAEAYSFNADTAAAIREAAQSIPHDSPLSSIETPNTGAGWFWFAEPLPIVTSSLASESVHALLWGWAEGFGRVRNVTLGDDVLQRMSPADRLVLAPFTAGRLMSKDEVATVGGILRRAGVTSDEFERMARQEESAAALMFSAYVLDERGIPLPSTRWFWPVSLSFHDMLAFNTARWEDAYGAGSPLEHDPNIMDREATLKAIGDLSLFFLMACVWFTQTVPILTREPGHVERHARKRFAREHKLTEPPKVQVVALRKSQRVPAEKAEGEQRVSAREYQCRWIVKGHPRLQACGPGRKDRKLIWINAHPAGPDGKPLRTREKVFAVVR